MTIIIAATVIVTLINYFPHFLFIFARKWVNSFDFNLYSAEEINYYYGQFYRN